MYTLAGRVTNVYILADIHITYTCIDRKHVTLKAISVLLSCVVEITALYNVKSILTDFSASTKDKRVL